MKFLILNLIIILSTKTVVSEIKVINAGIGGNNTIDLLNRIDTDVISKDPGMVVVMAGTNDMLNSRKMLSYEEYSTNLRLITQKLKKSGMEVILISPPPVDSIFLFERHDRELFIESPNAKLDSISHINREIAFENNVYFIDLFEIFRNRNIPKHNEDLFIRNPKNSGIRDGVHPTEKGLMLIAEIIYRFLKENYLLRKDMKILCFGDSITRGINVSKKGEISVASYPSYLLGLLDSHFQLP